MRKISQKIATALGVNSEKGVTAIEYGLLASLIALAIIVAVTALGGQLSTTFGNITAALKAG